MSNPGSSADRIERPRWVPRWMHSMAVGMVGGKTDDHDNVGPVSGAIEGAVLADAPGAAVGFLAGVWMRVRGNRRRQPRK